MPYVGVVGYLKKKSLSPLFLSHTLKIYIFKDFLKMFYDKLSFRKVRSVDFDYKYVKTLRKAIKD